MANRLILVLKIFIADVLLVGAAALLAQKIDLTTADLGRHIQNGQLIINGSWHDKWAVLHTNFYSYTMPEQPFINHHWLSGVVFYWLWLAVGFVGLSWINILLSVLTLLIFLKITVRESNFWLAAALGFLSAPTAAFRQEVRPEMFTYLFCGITFYLLWEYRQNRLSYKWLYLLPALQLLWVNLHIGFIFGIFVLGAFGLEELWNLFWENRGFKISKQVFFASRFWALLKIGILEAIAVLCNPWGLKGALYPFFIFKNYGYLVVENQSVRFLENLGARNGLNFLPFKAAFVLLALSFVLIAIFKRKKISVALLALAGGFSYASWTAIRNFPLFGFFVLPIMVYNFYQVLPKKIILPYKLTLIATGLAIAGFGFSQGYLNFQEKQDNFGAGLTPGVNGSADFIKAANLKGPILNNYDIGGYLIFNLYPEKVFVDNRPEAYTADFAQNVYIAVQSNPAFFAELDAMYHFNAIVYSHRDFTPWGQKFLIDKITNPDWAPVFADSYNIVFARRNKQNQEIIKQYDIPADHFRVLNADKLN